MKCGFCGSDISDQANFCLFCGKKTNVSRANISQNPKFESVISKSQQINKHQSESLDCGHYRSIRSSGFRNDLGIHYDR